MEIVNREFLNVKTATCHASTMAFYNNEPVFAWFGGTREGMPDSSIYVQYKDEIKSLGTKVQMAYWNPILFTIENELFLAYKVGKFCDCWQTYILNITNFDIDENNAQVIPAGLNFCVKTKFIMDSLGHIHCGSSVETSYDWTSFIETYNYQDGKFIFEERSKPLVVDKRTYTFEHPWYGKITQKTMGIIQPSLWIDKHNVWHAFFRSSRGLGKIYHSQKSSNEWSVPEPTEFNNPNSGIDTVYMHGRLFLVYNPSLIHRVPLVIAELNDDFDVIDEIIIQDKVEGKVYSPELSYPYIVEKDAKLHLVYTYGRTSIEHVTIQV